MAMNKKSVGSPKKKRKMMRPAKANRVMIQDTDDEDGDDESAQNEVDGDESGTDIDSMGGSKNTKLTTVDEEDDASPLNSKKTQARKRRRVNKKIKKKSIENEDEPQRKKRKLVRYLYGKFKNK